MLMDAILCCMLLYTAATAATTMWTTVETNRTTNRTVLLENGM